jgi:hypothetical protein
VCLSQTGAGPFSFDDQMVSAAFLTRSNPWLILAVGGHSVAAKTASFPSQYPHSPLLSIASDYHSGSKCAIRGLPTPQVDPCREPQSFAI